MKLKYLKTVFVILILCFPFATILSTTANESIDIVIYLERPEKQVVADELILKAESLGFTVNPIYVSFEDWIIYAHVTHDYDLLYGPYMTLPKDMTIIDIAFIEYILSFVILSADNKILRNTGKLVDMYIQAMMNPELLNDEDFVNDMVDKFHDNQERYWEKQYYSVFVQFETETSDEWGVPSMRTDTLNYNCLSGRVFANTDLRIQLNSIIDRTVFLDYHTLYTPYPVYEVHHLYQFSTFHDCSLPNNYNF